MVRWGDKDEVNFEIYYPTEGKVYPVKASFVGKTGGFDIPLHKVEDQTAFYAMKNVDDGSVVKGISIKATFFPAMLGNRAFSATFFIERDTVW